MEDQEKRFSVEISEKGNTYYSFEEEDFKTAEKRAEEFVRKGSEFSATIYDEEDVVEIINWDSSMDQIVYILTSYGKYRGFEITDTK